MLTGVLEASHKLRAAVDLDRPNRKRYALDQFVQCSRGKGRGGVTGYRRHRPAADHIDRRELLEDEAGLRLDFSCVHLHEVAWRR